MVRPSPLPARIYRERTVNFIEIPFQDDGDAAYGGAALRPVQEPLRRGPKR